ncbi:MAG: hypothetical protein M3Y77_14215 [Actinomycetota bacterium]|nr:hypothetical protein [Actinomycetota bacterium]
MAITTIKCDGYGSALVAVLTKAPASIAPARLRFMQTVAQPAVGPSFVGTGYVGADGATLGRTGGQLA